MTPLLHYPRLSDELGINLYVKHDDLYPFTGGGSKARKISYIIAKAKRQGCNALVSAGASNSNHARVVALVAAQLGWKCTLIIHDTEDYSNGNLLLMKLSGANLVFCEQKDVKVKMDEAMLQLGTEGYNPFYIWGGGHLVEGALAYYEAFKELKQQAQFNVDYIVHASGTGTTQAGLQVGATYDANYHTRILGISVARNKERGTQVLKESVEELVGYLQLQHKPNNTSIDFYDNWVSGGYGCYDSSISETIKWAAQTEGLVLDPTYTGKAFTGMIELIRASEINGGANVVFWHTGGLLNLLNSNTLINQ